MGYTVVKSFERGIDTRKLRDTTEPGALLDARDCHVTLGGEVEKRAAFVVTDTLPSETIGLYVTDGRVYNTWGDSLTPPAGLPAGTVYHPAPDPDGSPLAYIMSVEEFNSALHVIAKYEPTATYEEGRVIHWWKDDIVRAPTIAGGTPPATTPGNKPQVLSGFFPTTFGGGPPPDNNVHLYAIWLVSPTTTYNFGPTGTIDAYMLIPTTGTLPDGSGRPSNDITVIDGFITGGVGVAAAAEAAVNGYISTPNVSCQADGSQVNYWVDVPGTQYNGWKLEFRVSYCIPSGPGMKYTLTGGIDPILAPPPPPGPGDPIDKGNFALAHNNHMWSVKRSTLYYSAPGDPAEWNEVVNNGAGFIDMTKITARAPALVSLADYRGDLAVFGRRHILLWHLDVDLTGSSNEPSFKKQTIHGTGTFAPHSTVPFGEGEVMYLDISGIRSLRARDSSESAFAADIGTMIDELVKTKIASLTEVEKYFNVWGAVEPRSGRLWMALKDKIFVLSFYPSSRIAAWTWYDATTAPVDYMNTSDNTVYWRSGDNVIAYGGEEGDEYDDTESLVRLPYVDGGKNATLKNWTGLDAAIYGTWVIRGSFDPTVPAALDLLATITKSTYAQQKIAMNGESPAISLELRTEFVGPARIGNATVHYSDSTAD